MSNLPLSEQFRIVAKKWVDANAAASILEETKTAVLSQKMLALGEMPVSRAEMQVKASPEWNEHLIRIVEARKAANFLKVHMDYLDMQSWEHRSHEATQRAEMKL